MVGQAAKGKAALQRPVSLPSLVAPEAVGQVLQKEFDIIEETLVALQGALQDKNVQLTAKLLKRFEGARYEKLVSRFRAKRLWSLEEQLASRVCKARAVYIGWQHQYKAQVAMLEGAVDAEDLQMLQKALHNWAFHASDTNVDEADKVRISLEQDYVEDLKYIQEAVKSKELETIKDCIKTWRWNQDDANLIAIKELRKMYEVRRKHARRAIENRDLGELQNALDNIPVKSEDADILHAQEQRKKWEDAIEEALPVLKKAVDDGDIKTLRKYLAVGSGTVDFHGEKLLPARDRFREMQMVQANESRALREALAAKDPEAVQEAVDSWSYEEETTHVLHEARRLLALHAPQKTVIARALAAGNLGEVEALVEAWVLGPLPDEAREIVVDWRRACRDLSDAVDRRNIVRVSELLKELESKRGSRAGGSSAEIFKRADAMLEVYEAAKKRIADPTCHLHELKRLLDNWAYPKGEEFTRGRAREKAYSSAVHKLEKAATVYSS
jgi:hypothetical protein